MKPKTTKKHALNVSIKNNLGISLIKRNGQNNNNNFKNPITKPTNVEGHYPRFMLPGAVNLLEEDRREMSIILESFLPQLERIGVQIDEINNLIREIITSTEIFRRLKGISQIELLPFAFKQVPWFTRYTHSCLTYVLSDHVIDKLNNKLNLEGAELEAAKLSFLIHDLGHGPFSHLTERAFKKPKTREGKVPKEYDHEYWTKVLLTELQESLFDTNVNPYLPQKTVDLSQGKLKKSKEYNLDIFSKALAMISKNHHFIVSQLLSSQIDIDRLSNYIGDRLIVSGVLE
ncbi:MAG: HD domain-containing protein, partial [Candidatus Melainabacteria bacterium]|nr:HD domain-containing protein [Candidatus Melainabacteria bacterium]